MSEKNEAKLFTKEEAETYTETVIGLISYFTRSAVAKETPKAASHLLAGTGLFLFSVLSDSKKWSDSFGEIYMKIAVAFLVISFVCGVVTVAKASI